MVCDGRCLECKLLDKPCIPGIGKLKVAVFFESGEVEFYLGTQRYDLVAGDRFDIHIKGSMTSVPCIVEEVEKND